MANQWLNSELSYGWISIILHWISAVLVFVLLCSGIYMVDLHYLDPWAAPLGEWHALLGILLAVLTVVRGQWLLISRKPKLVGIGGWQSLLAQIVHLALYALLYGLPITGYFILTADGGDLQIFGQSLMVGLFELSPELTVWVGEGHQWLAYGLGGLVVLHTLAALKHHFIRRDSTLKRILYPQK